MQRSRSRILTRDARAANDGSVGPPRNARMAPVLRRVLPRLGFAATGVLYGALGVVAAQVAIASARHRAAGLPAALRLILGQPHGRLVLAAVAAGLAGFALWHVLEARRKRRAVLARLGHLAAAFGYGALAWSAAAVLVPQVGKPGAIGASALRGLWSSPAGRPILFLSGAIAIAGGLSELWQGASGRLAHRFATSWLPRASGGLARAAARFGLACRGLVFLIAGFFQIRVARSLAPRAVAEFGGAFEALSRVPIGGPWLAAAVAAGLIAYGLYMGLLAVAWRR